MGLTVTAMQKLAACLQWAPIRWPNVRRSRLLTAFLRALRLDQPLKRNLDSPTVQVV